MKKIFNKILIAIIVLLIIFVGVLTFYKFGMYKKPIEKPVEKPKENEEIKVEDVDITDAVIQKYYGYISSNERIANSEFDKELNYILDHKNDIAFAKTFDKTLIQEKKCSLYADYIVKEKGNEWLCNGIEWDDKKSTNKSASITISVINGDDIKNAVETLFGKGSYKAKDFKCNGPYESRCIYKEDTNEYLSVYYREFEEESYYETDLIKAEKDSNHLYIYEKFKEHIITIDEEDTKEDEKEVGVLKHTFEKNTYDDNYHYVKSEKTE